MNTQTRRSNLFRDIRLGLRAGKTKKELSVYMYNNLTDDQKMRISLEDLENIISICKTIADNNNSGGN